MATRRPELVNAPRPTAHFSGSATTELSDWLVSNDICPERVSDGGRSVSFHYCHKPIKTEGALACNIHLAAERRRSAGHATKVEAREAQQVLEQESQALVDRLLELGVTAGVGFSYERKFTGGVTLTGAAAEDLIEKLEKGIN